MREPTADEIERFARLAGPAPTREQAAAMRAEADRAIAEADRPNRIAELLAEPVDVRPARRRASTTGTPEDNAR